MFIRDIGKIEQMGILSCAILKVIVKLYLCSKTGLNHATVTTEFIPSTLRCFTTSNQITQRFTT